MRSVTRSGLAFLTAAMLLAHARGRAVAAKREPWQESCERTKNVPFPAADQPDETTRTALRGCTSESLFYGIGVTPAPEKARLCAYVEREAGDDVVFGGSAILMTIYATGVGARRNPDLAIRLACGLDGAPAEQEYRVAHLEKLKSAKSGTPIKFSLCDDVSSGFMQGHCAAHEQRMADAKRDAKYASRLEGWTTSQKAAFQKLRTEAAAFFRARSANEVDLSGTARAALQIEEERALEEAFRKLLEKLDKGTLPAATAADLTAADHELNTVYQKALRSDGAGWGTVTKGGIRETERSWPKYRDAWAELVVAKYPKTDPTAIKVWLTRERTGMLNEFVASSK